MTPTELLECYKLGFFPMAKSRDDDAFDIVAPHIRALLPIRHLHVPKRLRRKVLHFPFRVSVDTAFGDVIAACADARPDTWINNHIISLFIQLHEMGKAHSIECFSQEGKLVGGLYGIELGGTFCGESMFSTETDASKIALVHLAARLDKAGFSQLDSQFRNPHLDQFGLYERPQDDYVHEMRAHLNDQPCFSIHQDEELLVKGFLSGTEG